jgi:hypothetical protein
MPVPAPDVITFAREAKAFSHLGGYERSEYDLNAGGEPIHIPAARVTAEGMEALGVQPAAGRLFTAQEDEESAPVAVLSDALWHERFGADPQVIGRKITLDRKPYTVIGVMPRPFEFPVVPGKLNQIQVWVPMSFTPTERADNGDNFQYHILARLKPGVSLAQAQQDANRVAQLIQAE